jgi:hypothetical protein
MLWASLVLMFPSPGAKSWTQNAVHSDSTSIDSSAETRSIVPSDSTRFFSLQERFATSSADTLPKTPHHSKSPGLAMLFSALVPGAGQLYNESYWKVPIVLGFGIYFGSQWLHNDRLYRDYRDRYAQSLLQDPNGIPRLKDFREFYKDQRDTFSWYLAILYFINVADAYVDASLYDFNVGSDLSIRLMPEAGTRLTLRVSF